MSMADAVAHSDDLSDFVQASPSSYHAAHEVLRRLRDAGFTELDEAEPWPDDPGGYVVVRDGAVMGWVVPDELSRVPRFRILGAHTDSPGFMVKPEPSFVAHGWEQLAIEIYGGPLLNSWLDRELEVAGRVTLTSGETRLVRSGPLVRIPQLAIHLDREVNAGLTLDRQRHTAPIFALADDAPAPLFDVLASQIGHRADHIAGHDLVLADTQEPRRFGLGNNLFASGRLDNLSSVHAATLALLDAPAAPDGVIPVLAFFDHEELGSASRSGASGPFLSDVVNRVMGLLDLDEEDRHRALAQSWCISADTGHGVHPNYPEKHDPSHRPRLGGGPLLKVNANQRYATDALGSALWERLCSAADAPYQTFVSNNSVPCGSTIGPLTATRLGIRTVDVGIPLLSMHSARELAHVDDLVVLRSVIEQFFAGEDYA